MSLKKKKEEFSVADSIINGTWDDGSLNVDTSSQVANTVNTLDTVSNNIKKSKTTTMSFDDDKKEETSSVSDNIIKGVNPLDKAVFVGKSAGAGLTSGLTGVVDAPLQNIQEGAQKGKKKSKLENYVQGLAKTLDIYGITNLPEIIKESGKIIQDKNKKGWEKALNIGGAILNNNPLVNNLEAAGQQLNIFDKNAEKDIKKVRKIVETPSNKLNESVAKDSEKMSGGWKTAGEVSQVIGNMIPSMALTAVTKNPDIGLAAMGVSAKGQATKEAEERGADLNTANEIGLGKGLVEVGTEKLTGGLKFFGKGTADDLVEKGINKAIKNKAGNFIAKQAVGIAGEVGEETISDLVGTAIDKATVDPDASYSFDDWKKTALMTMLSTGALNTISGGYGKKAYQLNAEELNDIAQSKKVQDTVNKRVEQFKTPDMTPEQVEQLREQTTAVVLGEIQQNVDDILDSSIAQLQEQPQIPTQTPINTLSSNIQEHNSQILGQEQTPQITPLNQVNQELQETRQQDVADSVRAMNLEQEPEFTQKQGNYVYEKSDNSKIDNLRKDAANYLKEGEQTTNFVNTLEKLVKDKDIEIRFDTKLGNNVNGTYKNGVITINPNSNRAGEFVAIHELTHAIGTKPMIEMIQKYRNSNAEFNSAVERLLSTYNTTEINEEALGDISGQLFGNQEYINNLSMENPSLFKRIYNEIKYLWHQFRGYKNQNQFIEDLRNKWESAYRNQEVQNKQNTKYSLIGENGLENLKDNYYDSYINLTQALNEAKKMESNNEANKKIWEKTGWYKDRNGRWKYEITDKNMEIKPEIKIKENHTYKLGDLINHENLFKLYPELKDVNVKFRDFKKPTTGGNFNDISNTISINNNKVGDNQSIEGTLIHEIQHKIQSIEKFESGANTRLSKLRYYNSLGEIEASNVRERFEQEKYKNYNLDYIEPLSVDPNAKHKGLDKYLKDRKTYDKIKDRLFSKVGVDNAKSSEEIDFEDKNKNSGLDDGRRGLDNSSFSMDNTGRQLSKQQQEYFKDSKARDENGNLIELYHGTPNEFTKFNYDKLGTNGTLLGKGFYLTDDINVGEAYANKSDNGKIMKLYADIQKPLKWGEKSISKSQYKDFVEAINEETNGTLFADYSGEYSEKGSNQYNSTLNDILMDYEYGGDDIDLISGLLNSTGMSWEKAYRILKDVTGYDGIIVTKDVYDSGEGNVYIPFLPEQIKNVDNLNPTEDSDIRYSKDNQTWREYLEKEFPSQGTRTNLQDINERNKPLNKKEKTELDGLRALVETGLMNEEETTRLRELERRNKIKDTTKALNLEKETKTKYSINENAKDDYVSMKVDKAIQKNIYKNVNKATKTAENFLKFDREQKANFKDSIKELSTKTREQLVNSKSYNQVKDIVNNFANVEYNFVDEELKSIKKEIRNTKINIPTEIREQITDYSDFRKQSKLNITKDGQNIDSVWQELSNEYPHIFSSDIQTEADMLYALSDLMNKDTKITEKYRIPDSDLKYATDKIYNSLLNNSITQTELDSIQEDLSIKAARRTRQVVQNELLNQMGITLEDIETGKDINAVRSQLLDPRRLNEEVFSPKVAKKINDATVNFVSEQEANSNRFKNKERQEIKDLGIKARSKESAAVQKYGEKEWINDKGELLKYGDEQLAKDFPNVETQEKIKNAARVLRNKYDNYIDKINASLEDMGYDPIPKRKDYFKHFYEISDKLSQWGVPFNANSMNEDLLPTDINGLTDEFKPGKNWFASAQQRTGKKTIYDAITGIDQYLDGASNLIFHTESIQRYRTLSKFIRDTYGQVNGLDNAANLSEAQIQKRIEDIQSNKLSRYAAWLDEQANAMAGKKGKIDRGIEEFFGRRVYSALNTLKSQVGSNMTGFNVRSAMTNFASAIQGASKVKKTAFLKGTLSTLQNIVNNDGLIDKSNFLTNRFGSDSISKKAWQKVANAGQIFMTGTDYFTANQIWRSKYFENMSKGMSETQAIKNADDFAARIMGDRSKGQTAAAFNSKTLGFLTQFQLEVNNQWQSMIHDNKMDIKTGNKSGATVLFQLGQLAAMSNLFNLMMKSLTGSDVMFDPVDILKGVFKPDDDDKDKDLSERMREALGKIVDQLPMASVFTGGRIPIGEAFKGISTGAKYLTGGTNKWGQPLTTKDVKKDMLEALPYWILPTGWGQIRKTKQGLSMYSKDKPVAGSYTDSGNLRFTADTSLGGKTKAALFGQYSSKEAQDYIKGGFKTITKGNNIDELKNLGYTSSQYKKYRQELNATGRKNQEKIDYIMGLDIPKKEKDVMASRVLRKPVNTNDIKKFDTLIEFNKWYKKNKNN